jgi:hypothetical protein
MCRYQLKYILLILIVSSSNVFAQTSSISNPLSGRVNLPYSRFGIGEEWNSSNTLLKGMGNITSAYADPYAINTDNPASFAFLKNTTYEGGAAIENHSLITGSNNYNTGTATISYMNIAFPTNNRHFGFCLGMRPFTHIYYNLADTTKTGPDTLIGGQVIHNYSGGGSVNYLFVGAAARYGGFSAGVTFGYLFGNVTTLSRLINNDTTNAYNSTFEQISKIGGIYWKGGLMYETPLNKNYTLRIGATVALQQTLNVWRNEYWIASYSLADTFIADTTYASQQAKGTIVMPMSYTFGIQLAKGDHWLLGVDYAATQWGQFRNFGNTDSVANQTSKLSIGGQYTPNAAAVRNYWSRVTYRMGLYYGTNYVYLRNTTFNNYGVTVGASLPFKHTTDRVHLAFDFGKTGTTANNLIQDNYFKFSIGVSFNDKWFTQRKYE